MIKLKSLLEDKATDYLSNALDSMTTRDEKKLAKEFPKNTKVKFVPNANMFDKDPFKKQKVLVGKVSGYRGGTMLKILSLDGKKFKGYTTNQFEVSTMFVKK